jgi:hypothetical protein
MSNCEFDRLKRLKGLHRLKGREEEPAGSRRLQRTEDKGQRSAVRDQQTADRGKLASDREELVFALAHKNQD